ncbi:DUF805 domain-containing protein [Jannaschia formosa]|uniref:DUF805 domain-containing protein n=1 Tax=Jannaschia formosa TaxID=2259592 RepID=UPI000E1B669C|nr:DUF805 domain-containing protein [Jannaschia formosa]TFL16872.1 DUF805 domain-containing protein [Jannaschia formosa]
MGPIDATFRCLARPLTWSGRAAPSEYWWFTLVYTLVGTAVWLGLLWPVLELVWLDAQGLPRPVPIEGLLQERLQMMGWAAVLGLWPSLCHLAVMVRRLHDTDRSGWWYWITLLPLVGPLILLVLLILPGDPGQNDYGKSPYGPAPGEVGRPGAGVARDLPPLDPGLRAPVPMGPVQATVSCLLAPLTFRGRAGPGEFWWFMLVVTTASVAATTVLAWPVLTAIDAWEAAMLAEQQRAYETFTAAQPVPFPDLRPVVMANWIGWAAYAIVGIPVSLSCIAVTIRRLHDTDHSGWWQLIGLVPLIGPVFLLVLLAAPGQIHRNRYGRGTGVREAPVRGSDLPVVPRDPLAGVTTPEALRALRQSRMPGN